MSIFDKSILIVSGSVAATLLSAIESIIISRNLGPEATGQYQLAVTLSITVVTVFSLGIGQANIYFLNTQKLGVEKIVNNTLIFSVIFGLISSIVLLLVFYFCNKLTGYFSNYVIVSLSFSSIFVLLHVFFGQILIAQMSILQFNVSSLSSKIFSIMAFVAMSIFSALNSENAIIIIVLYNIFAAIITGFFIRKYLFYSFRIDFLEIKSTICYGFKIHLGNLLLALDHNLSTIFIGILLPGEFEGIGYFTRAIAICTFIRFIPISLSNLLYAYWTRNNKCEMVFQLERAVRIYALIGSAILVFLVLYGEDLIYIFYGKAFLPAFSILKVLLIQQICWMISNCFQTFFLAAGMPNIITFNLLICNLLSITGMLLLIPTIGLIGAAYAITFAHAISLIINLGVAKKRFSLSPYNCFKISINDLKFFIERFKRDRKF